MSRVGTAPTRKRSFPNLECANDLFSVTPGDRQPRLNWTFTFSDKEPFATLVSSSTFLACGPVDRVIGLQVLRAEGICLESLELSRTDTILKEHVQLSG